MTTINTAALTYPFDRTGTATSNLVVNEARSVGREVYRAIAPYAGSFYTSSMVVTDAATGTALVLNTDYKLAYPNQEAELEVGKPICTVVFILNSSYTDVLLTYQAVGGPYTTSNDVIANILVDIQQDNRAVTWDAILGKPVTFNPSAHTHAATDLYGLEYVVLALEELVQAVYTGDVASHDVLYDYINRIKASVDDSTTSFNQTAADLRALIDQINVRIDTLTTTVTQQRTDFTAHTSDVNNPHSVTAAQVGLGLVSNYRLATQTEAETGTAANVYMTALTTWQAITKFNTLNILPVINTHVNNKSNPHGVTATQVGLGNVLNVKQVQAGGGINMSANNVYFGYRPGTGMVATIDSTDYGQVFTTTNPDPNFTNHVNNKSNPHNVTVSQIGATPTSRVINGHALTGDFNISAGDVGAYTTGQVDSLVNATVQDVRWSGESQQGNGAYVNWGNGRKTNTPDGTVISNLADYSTSQVWIEDVDNVWYRYLQKKINGTWYNVGT